MQFSFLPYLSQRGLKSLGSFVTFCFFCKWKDRGREEKAIPDRIQVAGGKEVEREDRDEWKEWGRKEKWEFKKVRG